MGELPHFDRKMSDAEGLMWRLEKDPHLSSTFANVTVLDRPPDFEQLVRRMERAVYAVPRLHQRVQPAPVNLSSPMWVDDPNFDIRYHVRHVVAAEARHHASAARPRQPHGLRRLRPHSSPVAVRRRRRLARRQERTRAEDAPHHRRRRGWCAAVDCSSSTLERDAKELPPLDPELIAAAEAAASPEVVQVDLLHELLNGSLRVPITLMKQVRDLLADPIGIPAAGSAAADTVRGVLHQLGETDAARSPLWTARSLRRRMEVLRAPFGATREAANRLGGTLNTAFLTAAAEAAGRYHREMGGAGRRASVAAWPSAPAPTSSGANAFSLARMLVPTGDMPIGERFAAIHTAAHEARDARRPAARSTHWPRWPSRCRPASSPASARQQAQTVDFATSNVRGAPIPLYLAGAQLLENYPVGPLLGVAYNLTLLSYNHSLDMGVNIDTEAVSRPRVAAALPGASVQGPALRLSGS